jgi:hypothetical protein
MFDHKLVHLLPSTGTVIPFWQLGRLLADLLITPMSGVETSVCRKYGSSDAAYRFKSDRRPTEQESMRKHGARTALTLNGLTPIEFATRSNQEHYRNRIQL